MGGFQISLMLGRNALRISSTAPPWEKRVVFSRYPTVTVKTFGVNVYVW